jgi:hypothetical protein
MSAGRAPCTDGAASPEPLRTVEAETTPTTKETFPVALEVGGDAPPATLLDHDGDEVTVPVDGRTSVLVFYRGDW